jgi:hypothetical protein
MASDMLRMREEEFDTLAATLANSSNNVSQTGGGIGSKFAGAVDAGLLGDSVSKVSSQMAAISTSISNVQNIVKKHSNQMFSFDRSMASKIEEIQIPTDLMANDSSEINTYTQTLLGKIDGQSVNNGQASTAFKEIDESVVQGEALTDIHGDQTQQQTYDASSGIGGQQAMRNISGDQTQQQNYDATSVVNKE